MGCPKIRAALIFISHNILPHHLSRIINEHHMQNFIAYINQYRLNEFTLRLCDSQFKKYSLLAIAFDYGFNLKTTYNRCFKKITDSTPSGYRKMIK